MLDVSEALFKPYGNLSGVSKLYFVSARATTPSTITITMDAGSEGGEIAIQTVEGLGSVGSEDAGVLKTGFAVTMHSGTFDSTKFVFKFWKGTDAGNASDNTPYSGISRADSKPALVAQTDEISNVLELVDFCNGDINLLKYFKYDSANSTVVGAGAIDPADLTALAGSNILATGGTETYSASELDAVLSAVKDLDYSIVLSDKSGADSGGAENLKILNHLETEARFDKFLFVGGGNTSSTLASQSGSTAIAFDSVKAHVVHGGILKNLPYAPGGVREYSSLHKAAYFVGRMAGLEPYVPMTFKVLSYDGEVHEMNEEERKYALKNGVITTKYDSDFPANVVIGAVNTIQNNSQLLNSDGTSYSIQAMRVISQINKIIEIQSKLSLLSDQTGQNPATKSSLKLEAVRLWTSALLSRYEGTLITSFQNITVKRDQDAIFINYEVSLNSEIRFMFFGGTIVNL
jgi:hypothetical protein